jgi:hypothetical protein
VEEAAAALVNQESGGRQAIVRSFKKGLRTDYPCDVGQARISAAISKKHKEYNSNRYVVTLEIEA